MKLRETLCLQLVDTTCSQSPQSAALPAAKLRPKLPKSNKGCLVKASNSAPTTLDGGQAISLGGAPAARGSPFLFVVVPVPFFCFFLDCFSFFVFSLGTPFFCLFFLTREKTKKEKQSKKKQKKGTGTTAKRKGLPRAAGAPPRLIACPPSRVVGALFEVLTRQPLLDFGSLGRSLAAGNAADCGL